MAIRKTRLFTRTLGVAVLLSLALSLAVPFSQARLPTALAEAESTDRQDAGDRYTSGSVQSTPQPVASPAVTAAPRVEQSTPYTTHTVVKGDTLFLLAKEYGISVDALAQANGLPADAWLSVGQVLRIPASSQSPVTTLPSRGTERGAVAIPWSEVDGLFPRGSNARLTDVRTGRSFTVRRRGGWAHADVEPLTSSDTKTMLSIWGQWSWARRPMVVEVANRRIAASMVGMPHGGQVVTGNGVSGHFCLHFLGSTTHGSSYTKSGVPRVDSAHQAAVREAVGK